MRVSLLTLSVLSTVDTIRVLNNSNKVVILNAKQGSIAFDSTLILPSKDARFAALSVPFLTGPLLMDR